MTMESMVKYLTARGFEVDKHYDTSKTVYRFRISKDGYTLTQYFRYPVSVEPVVRDRIQREFLDGMIEKFHKDILKEKEREMATRKINWKVGEMQAETSADGRFIYTQLVGVPDPLFCGSFSDVKNDLQRYMDKYMAEDEETVYLTKAAANDNMRWRKQNPYISKGIPSIENVVFNNPATIVFWKDGTKTVVKCQNDDVFDPEKGLAMAIVKKVLGNKGNYCNEIKKWLPNEKL